MKSAPMPFGNGVNHQLPQIIAILTSSVTGVSDGMLFAWTSPSIPALIADNSTMNITLEQASYFTTISSFAMMITAPLFLKIADLIGRKNGVLLVAFPQILAWVLTGLATNIWMLYAARFVAGMGDALFFATVPIYVCEIAEPHVRGSWGNILAVSIYLGVFLINLVGAYNDILTTAVICGCVPLVHIFLFWFMPESPFYLLMKNKEDEAIRSLKLLRWRNDVEEELEELKDAVQTQVAESGTMKELFTVSSYRKALIMCVGIRVVQQLSGLSAFEMYTQYLFLEAGGSVTEKDASLIFAGILTLVVGISSYLVEKFGRKPLMSFSCLGCGILLAIETVYFALTQFTDLDLSSLHWLPLTGMIGYIVVCATGIGILPTLILGEIFSANIKGKASAIMNVVTGACLLFVPKLFISLTDNFGIYSPFAFFSLCCFAGVIFSHFCVIETKGKTLEEIQQDLRGKKKIKKPKPAVFIDRYYVNNAV